MDQQKAFQRTLRQFARTLLFWLVLIVFMAWTLGLFSPSKRVVGCDAEKTSQHLRKKVFRSGKTIITGGHLQSNEYAFQGQHSVKLTRDQPFGLQFVIPALKGNERITISVWRFAPDQEASPGVIVGNVKGQYWDDCSKIVEQKDGWERLECTLDPPFSCRGKDLDIYCWNRGPYPVYFDEMRVIIDRLP